MIFITHRNLFLAIALGIVAVSVGILVRFGLPLGIDFTGGALTEISYTERPEKVVIEEALINFDLGAYSLRETVSEDGKDGYVLRTRDLREDERIGIEDVMKARGQDGELERFASVGPVIGNELREKAKWAIGGVVLVIVLYLAYAFREMGRIGVKPVSSWIYGLITIAVLIHDVLVPTAAFSLLGVYMGAEADVLFVMALLAILGYSVNDTIVIFDRVRENLQKNQTDADQLIATHGKSKKEEADAIRHEPFNQTVGRSVSESLLRSINTSFTTMLALVALYWLGGDITENFALMLLAGVFAGAYSSVAIASPLLIFISERLPERAPVEVHTKTKPPAPGMPV